MDLFPKKYNNKNVAKKQKEEKTWIELYSPNIPLDQKINPGTQEIQFLIQVTFQFSGEKNILYKNAGPISYPFGRKQM